LMRIAAGGALARSETTRMVTEKVQALGEAQTVAAVGSVTGRNRRSLMVLSLRCNGTFRAVLATTNAYSEN
jgi:hypothetical protein